MLAARTRLTAAVTGVAALAGSVLGVATELVTPAVAEAVSCRVGRTLHYEMRGDEVLCLERRLKKLEYLNTSIDTYFGTNTLAAVKRFQTSRGLESSGVVGPKTASALRIGGSSYTPTHYPIETRTLGRSVNGHKITAWRYGTPGGKVVVAMGQIHGNEPGGTMIAAYLRVLGAPVGIDMWVIDSSNPDGWRAQTRTNARGVDLNRNFDSGNWVYGGRGTGTYSGRRAASEPETRAVQRLLDDVRPRLMIVWHQVGRHVDDNRSVGNYDLLRQYSSLTGYPIQPTGSCTTCGGTATSYVNLKFANSTAFTVEMPSSFTYGHARNHGKAFLALAANS
ncbi:MAG: peptidoglycan-binding protein [Actinomycetota bacterium]|nr:peptidoglycan-binding protein [Actinomycetota bacterium]